LGSRSSDLADRFEAAIAELAQAVEASSATHWAAICGDEGWTVAATAHHVGAQWPLELELISACAEGRPFPAYTWDDINAKNEEHAQTTKACSKDEVLALLREESPSVAAYVRGLSDEQLDRSGAFPLADGAMVTTQQLIEGGVLIDHAQAHLRSIPAAS